MFMRARCVSSDELECHRSQQERPPSPPRGGNFVKPLRNDSPLEGGRGVSLAINRQSSFQKRLLSTLSIAILALFSPFSTNSFAQNYAFNTDSAYANLEHLAVTIGPRMMGSVNEREALAWVTRRFASFGADTAYVMPIPHTKNMNTSTGTAVGIFPGRTDSMIVIGGHIDSDFRENPGANDDASGTAVMLELARVWSSMPRRYTLVFAAFGGEEGGLIGSKWFADHFEHIQRVALMLQIDMAGSDEELVPFLETQGKQAPKWLVQDAYAFDRALGFNSLQYPTHFFTLNASLPGGGAGSDHEPFLKKDIPAIDFTAGVNSSPIHTINDRMAFISKKALTRSGVLVEALMKKYDTNGIPSQRVGHYMLWQIFGGTFFVPDWAVFAFNVLAVMLGILAFTRGRGQRLQIEKPARVRFSGWKIFLMLILIAIFTQLGEALMQLIKGLRFPWVAHTNAYLPFAALWALLGAWLALQLTRWWRFTPDPYSYLSRGLVFMLLLTILFWLATPRLAFYPALSLLCICLAVFLPSTLLKVLFTLASPWPMLSLMFNEAWGLFSRTWARGLMQMEGFWPSFIVSAIFTVLLILWYLPALYTFAYTYARQIKTLAFLKVLRHPVCGLTVLLAVFGYGGYLYGLPSYNEMWRANLRAIAKYDLNTRQSKLELMGDEYFRGVTVQSLALNKTIDERDHKMEFPLDFTADWMSISGQQTREPSDSGLAHVNWTLVAARPWHSVRVDLQADTLQLSRVQSDLKFLQSQDRVTFRWSAEPPDTLHLAVSFHLPPKAKLIRTVTATYAEMPIPITVTAKYADAIYRTEVVQRDTL